MTSRERVINTLCRKAVDRVPYSFDMTSRIAGRMVKRYGVAPDEFSRFMGDDLLFADCSAPGVRLDNGRYMDEFKVEWDVSDESHEIGDFGSIAAYPLPEPDLAGYAFPDGRDPVRFMDFDAQAMKSQGRFVILGMTGLFDFCWHLRGFENFMMDMASGDAFAGALMDKGLEFNLDVVAGIPDGMDGVRIGEDWGLQKGLITGAPLWRKYLKPRLKILYEAVRKRGLKLFIHTCGDIAELFPDIIELGVEVVNPVQPEAMDIRFLQREYGKDIVMYGGLGSQSTLVFGTPADVVAEARDRLALFAGGGYILGPAGAIPTDAPDDNVAALVDFAMGL